jgi:hypothetical protein
VQVAGDDPERPSNAGSSGRALAIRSFHGSGTTEQVLVRLVRLQYIWRTCSQLNPMGPCTVSALSDARSTAACSTARNELTGTLDRSADPRSTSATCRASDMRDDYCLYASML